MKIDRLIGILSILLQNNKITAPYLAEKFEVSRRTINRDIEDLCKAGIPIITLQGSGGGITIADGYKMDKTLLSPEEMNAILTGLISLDSISHNSRYKQLMDKLKQESYSASKDTIYDSTNHIIINLSSHYKESLSLKIAAIRKAIEEKHCISFTYYSKSGESQRNAEPYLLIFEWGSWYVWSYCKKNMDFRMFKLNRIQNLSQLDDSVPERVLPSYKENTNQFFEGTIHVIAQFDPKAQWRLIDEYGIDCYKQLKNGNLLFEFDFSNSDFLLQWLLSFGDQVTILEPLSMRTEYFTILEKIKNNYQ
jgi:Predicted transcriptional regulator